MSESQIKRWMACNFVAALMALPALAYAQEDMGVTMRMVDDDQALEEEFVQELQLPSFLDEPLTPYGSELESLSGDSLQEMLDIETSLSEQTRETRDALGTELPGELELAQPDLDVPALETPELESPEMESPELEVPELLSDDPL